MAEEDNTLAVPIITKPGVLAFGKGLPAESSLAVTAFFQDETAIQVSCGQDHSAVVCESGRAYTFGANQGDGWMLDGGESVVGPSLVDTLIEVRISQVACGSQYTLFLTDKGQLYSCGVNHQGQLGLGHRNTVPTPVLVIGLPRIEKVAAGCFHTVVLTADRGDVWLCGDNDNGQLGLGHTNNQTSFTQVTNLPEPIIDISCGGFHTALITASGILLVTGLNEYGQLGLLGGVKNLSSFEPVSDASTSIAAVSCGHCHTVTLRVDGTSWACGLNSCGQVGTETEHNKTTLTKVVGLVDQTVCQVIAGWHHTAILTQEGDAWVWGQGTNEELALGKRDLSTATMLTKSAGLVVKQVAFAESYTLLLVVQSLTKTPEPQLQIEVDATNGCITDWEQSIMRSLECPICMKVMCAPIYQCTKGHSLCAACRPGRVCPLCRNPLTEARNFALESLSEDVRLPCSECLQRMPVSEIARHGEVCPGRIYGCPVGVRCAWVGRPPAMLAHATQFHAGSTWGRLPHMFIQTTTSDVLLAAHGQVFTLHRSYEVGERFRAAVRYIGPPKNAYNYQLELTVMTDSLNNTYRRNVCSDIGNVEDIYQSSNCVTMESDVVKTFLQRGRLLCRVAILEVGTRDHADQMEAMRSLHDEAAKTDDNN